MSLIKWKSDAMNCLQLTLLYIHIITTKSLTGQSTTAPQQTNTAPTTKMRFFSPQYTVVILVMLPVFVSSNTFPEPEALPEPKRKKHKYPGPLLKHNKHEQVSVGKIASCPNCRCMVRFWYQALLHIISTNDM
jgi:hypothetical protein